MMIKRRVAVVAPVAGFLLGVLDFVWIKYVPYPFAGLGNSLATWAVAAFLLTHRSRWRLPAAVLGAVSCLVLAVPSYYLAATVIQGDAWANLANATAVTWMGFGVVAGLVFGASGVLARTPGRLRLPALAVPAAVLFAEGAIGLRRLGDPAYATGDLLAYAALVVALGLAAILLLARTGRDRLLTLAWSLPLAAGGWVLLTVSGFR
ncbi:DUF6518 family protein [Actinoplanes sp. NPDC023936]|uniref:DUF6518 family protein n=1 Tax=Actinoplanes sp. NPDC023936 TaxID=3154910 RepID=UPI0033E1151F